MVNVYYYLFFSGTSWCLCCSPKTFGHQNSLPSESGKGGRKMIFRSFGVGQKEDSLKWRFMLRSRSDCALVGFLVSKRRPHFFCLKASFMGRSSPYTRHKLQRSESGEDRETGVIVRTSRFRNTRSPFSPSFDSTANDRELASAHWVAISVQEFKCNAAVGSRAQLNFYPHALMDSLLPRG